MRKELYVMNNKEQFKKHIWVSLVIFLGLALAITYFFLLYSNISIGETVAEIMLVLRPFIIGAVIAYLLKSTCNGYEKLLLKGFNKKNTSDTLKHTGKANVLSVVLTYITWTLVVGGLMLIAVPQVIESVTVFIQDVIDNLPIYVETCGSWISDLKNQYPDIAPYMDEAGAAIIDWVTNVLAPKLPEIGTLLLASVLELVNVLKDFVIGIIISVFMLAGRKVLARKTSLLVKALFKEKQAHAIINEARFADKMFGGFLEGKIIDSTIVGIIYFIALTLMDIRYAALLALICGVTNIIPFFGPFIGAVPSGLIILMSNDQPFTKLIYFIIFVCVAQFIDGYFIDPHIVGSHIKMSPFAVIFAVLVFGGLWGFGGLLIGVPTFAVIYDIIRKTIFQHLRKTGKKDILRKYLEDSGRIKPKTAEEAAGPAPTDAPTEPTVENTDDQQNQ